VGLALNPHARPGGQNRQSVIVPVTNRARLSIQIHFTVELRVSGAEDDLPLFIVDPYSINTGLVSQRRYDVVDILFAVEQHGVMGGTLNDITGPLGAEGHVIHEVPGVAGDHVVGVKAKTGSRNRGDEQKKAKTEHVVKFLFHLPLPAVTLFYNFSSQIANLFNRIRINGALLLLMTEFTLFHSK